MDATISGTTSSDVCDVDAIENSSCADSSGVEALAAELIELLANVSNSRLSESDVISVIRSIMRRASLLEGVDEIMVSVGDSIWSISELWVTISSG